MVNEFQNKRIIFITTSTSSEMIFERLQLKDLLFTRFIIVTPHRRFLVTSCACKNFHFRVISDLRIHGIWPISEMVIRAGRSRWADDSASSDFGHYTRFFQHAFANTRPYYFYLIYNVFFVWMSLRNTICGVARDLNNARLYVMTPLPFIPFRFKWIYQQMSKSTTISVDAEPPNFGETEDRWSREWGWSYVLIDQFPIFLSCRTPTLCRREVLLRIKVGLLGLGADPSKRHNRAF